jgi:hypothetical protein
MTEQDRTKRLQALKDELLPCTEWCVVFRFENVERKQAQTVMMNMMSGVEVFAMPKHKTAQFTQPLLLKAEDFYAMFNNYTDKED